MFLSIKKIPVVGWSSKETFNFKPKISTFSYLCFGLMLFGFGEALLVVSTTGNSPWTVCFVSFNPQLLNRLVLDKSFQLSNQRMNPF